MNEQQSQVVTQSTIYQTSDYDKFKKLKGNRPIDWRHVRELEREMATSRNLNTAFPIKVNPNMEVLDGQHTLEALKRLGWPVCYEVSEELDLVDVRKINSHQRNWTWRDYAGSFAEEGDGNYVRFLDLVDEFGFNYSIIYAYATGGQRTGKRGKMFVGGDFELTTEQYQLARERLENYAVLTECANQKGINFALACLDFMKRPGYNQAKMVAQLTKYSKLLADAYYSNQYLYRLEDIYNRP